MVICSSENEDRAHMAAALDQYRLGTIPHCASPKEIRQYLKTQFKPSPQQRGRFRDQILPWTPAAVLDKEGYVVFNGASLTFSMLEIIFKNESWKSLIWCGILPCMCRPCQKQNPCTFQLVTSKVALNEQEFWRFINVLCSIEIICVATKLHSQIKHYIT